MNEYLNSLTQKAIKVNDLSLKISLSSIRDSSLTEIEHLIHKLYGSGKTFGFKEISQAALNVLENIRQIKKTEQIKQTDIDVLKKQMERLKMVLISIYKERKSSA